jgi:hypothetical protein
MYPVSHGLEIEVITDGRNDPVEVEVGRNQFRVIVEIIGDHEVPVSILYLVEMDGHRVLPVIEVVNGKDQLMLEPPFRFAQVPVQGHIEPVIIGQSVIITHPVYGDLVIVVIVKPCGSAEGSPGHENEVAGQGKPPVKGPGEVS